jgi:hypothetical protein
MVVVTQGGSCNCGRYRFIRLNTTTVCTLTKQHELLLFLLPPPSPKFNFRISIKQLDFLIRRHHIYVREMNSFAWGLLDRLVDVVIRYCCYINRVKTDKQSESSTKHLLRDRVPVVLGKVRHLVITRGPVFVFLRTFLGPFCVGAFVVCL